MINIKSLAIAASAALIAGGALVSTTSSADAQWRRGGWHGGGWGGGWHGGYGGWRGGGWRGGGWGGGAVAAGVVGGLALGALAASAAPAYAAPSYYYSGPLPAGTIPAYSWRGGYGPAYVQEAAPVRCWWQRQRVQIDPWTYQVRRVRVCD